MYPWIVVVLEDDETHETLIDCSVRKQEKLNPTQQRHIFAFRPIPS